MNIILHFGMFKTGSSSIQESLYRYLTDENVYYFNKFNHNRNGNYLAIAFFDKSDNLAFQHKFGDSIEQINRQRNFIRSSLAQQLNNAVNKTFLISAESISIMNKTSLIELKQFISKFSEQLRLVGYIRPPKGFMESNFQQRVKNRVSEFVPLSLFPKYNNFKQMDKIFGYDNVNVWKYEPTSFVNNDVVMDFCARLGIQFEFNHSIRVNEDLSLAALKLLYIYRKFGPGYGMGITAIQENNRLIEAIGQLKGQNLRFHSDLVRPILENNAAQIAWMEERLSASLIEDISKDDDIAICSEEDLLNIDENTTQWLAQQLGSDYENRWHEKLSVSEIANWIHDFRNKLSSKEQSIKPISKTQIKTLKSPKNSDILQSKNFAMYLELKEKPLSAFPQVSNFKELVDSPKDSLLIYKDEFSYKNGYLDDIGDKPYILSLHNPLLVPFNVLNCFLDDAPHDTKLPNTLKYQENNNANLLFTQQNEIVADSLTRGKNVHKAICYLDNGRWQVPMIEPTETIEEPCVFIDLVCGHFGHALVDTSARLWPLVERFNFNLQDYTFVGFGFHNITNNAENWPNWLKQLLNAYGIALTKLRILDKPTRCSNLLIPKRISPFITSGGIVYNQFMQQAGDRLLLTNEKVSAFEKKVFLSRSQLTKKKRSLGEETEKKLDSLFADLGFSVVHPQELSLAEQVSVVKNASHIVGCVGSQMHLTAFCNQKNFKVLRIAPAFFANNTDKKILASSDGVFEDYLIQCKAEPGAYSESSWIITESDLNNIHNFIIHWIEQ